MTLIYLILGLLTKSYDRTRHLYYVVVDILLGIFLYWVANSGVVHESSNDKA